MSPRWLFFPSAANDDWDTYADGIFTSDDPRSGGTVTEVSSSSNYFQLARIDGLSGSRFRLWEVLANGNQAYPDTNLPPYMAVFANSQWGVYMWSTDGTTQPGLTNYQNRYYFHDGNNFNEQGTDWFPGAYVFLSQYDGDVSSWSAYS
tara:strand:+ start:316 stop:759 length:444 start_codon:yes stop_codon:yes gene_type:complete